MSRRTLVMRQACLRTVAQASRIPRESCPSFILCWATVRAGLLRSQARSVVTFTSVLDEKATMIEIETERLNMKIPMSSTNPLHTYSVVAYDKKSGEMGVAVQSHWFSVGPVVPWAEAGVGVVATQALAEPAYGPRGLSLMRSGMSSADALKALLSADDKEDVRQVAMVDAQGHVSAHTGKRCIECADHHVGDTYSVQANMMLNDKVVPAMAKAYESAKGDIAERLILTLEAAEEVGGDIRGKQSAAMVIVKIHSTGHAWKDCTVDLRVDDHPEPLVELRRLLTVHRAYEHMNQGDKEMERGDMARALQEYSEAAELVPDNLEIIFWNAVTLSVNGHVDEAVPRFKRVFAADRNWAELLRRLPKAGLMPEELIPRLLRETRIGI